MKIQPLGGAILLVKVNGFECAYTHTCHIVCAVSSEPPQAMPQSFTALPGATIVHFIWTSPSPNVTICGYNLTCTPMIRGLDSITVTYTKAETHIDLYTLRFMGFRPATEYGCTVFAFNSAGNGPPAEINITTVDEGKPQLYIIRIIRCVYFGI